MSETHEIQSIQQTSCCIVGGGPAGAVLSLLLARQGIPVILLETHKNFDREFRGDTLHPSVMEILDQIGLADKLLEIPHTKMGSITMQSKEATTTIADFSQLKTKYPYVTILPQVKFLEFITAEAQRYPNFKLMMGANVQEIIEENSTIRGVRYRGHGGWHEIIAPLTVACDGRFSKLRQLAGFQPIKTSPPMDILWFRLPREEGDAEGFGVGGRIDGGHMMVIIDRMDYWQLGYVIFKSSYQTLRDAGIVELQNAIAKLAPEFANRTHLLQDWSQISLLSVESSRLSRWYRPGLLLIGDAAHVMSPVGGVGINYAIQDAVVAANILSNPLKTGQVEVNNLAAVQKQRELPTRIIQIFQSLMQQRIIKAALDTNQTFSPPIFLRLPILRDIPARLIAFGFSRVYLEL
ncbi:MAG TPA: monooxygenase [Cyanobacteria bacterium UBA11149]|nr:monooxygenase [Cyanobacteria bacterium UBA11367]HBE60958.1 monooxygenase [Cyanobacteria bacterium UBA11366]HBK65672.1 monooxygenase [Cyanobacteria bacterium UBA11166]HBR73233.1 monooxygenase [Cyanobacteria bacterium UBA11159]HBS68743.1 monooxygenase [Cyanobacteria bacterium UBA11153]HBW88980.1 monooxygenase [Cyanobacteria bacterium UBA11149]HCA95735.1 monooxygenase [Cyanobacteria bacterium UBA9226]